MNKILMALTMVFCLLNTNAAHAGVKVGDQIPTDLAMVDQTGMQKNFINLKGENGLVLVFVRSVDWCPYCMAQVRKIESHKSDFEKAEYNVAIASYDTPAQTAAFARKRRITLPLLSDAGSAHIKAFGILNTQYSPGHRAYGIPHPTIYVIDAEGKISHSFSEEGYQKRPDLELILKALGAKMQ